MNRLNRRVQVLEDARAPRRPGLFSPGVPPELGLNVLMGEGERYREQWPQAVAEVERMMALLVAKPGEARP